MDFGTWLFRFFLRFSVLGDFDLISQQTRQAGVFFLSAAESRIWRKQGPFSKPWSLKKSVSFQIGNISLPRLGFGRNRRCFSGFILNWEFVASEIGLSGTLGALKLFHGALFGFWGMPFFVPFLRLSKFSGFQPWEMLTLFSNETTAWPHFPKRGRNPHLEKTGPPFKNRVAEQERFVSN